MRTPPAPRRREAPRATPAPPRGVVHARPSRTAGDSRRQASLAELELANELLVFQDACQQERLVEIHPRPQRHGLRVLSEAPGGSPRRVEAGPDGLVQCLLER